MEDPNVTCPSCHIGYKKTVYFQCPKCNPDAESLVEVKKSAELETTTKETVEEAV